MYGTLDAERKKRILYLLVVNALVTVRGAIGRRVFMRDVIAAEVGQAARARERRESARAHVDERPDYTDVVVAADLHGRLVLFSNKALIKKEVLVIVSVG